MDGELTAPPSSLLHRPYTFNEKQALQNASTPNRSYPLMPKQVQLAHNYFILFGINLLFYFPAILLGKKTNANNIHHKCSTFILCPVHTY